MVAPKVISIDNPKNNSNSNAFHPLKNTGNNNTINTNNSDISQQDA